MSYQSRIVLTDVEAISAQQKNLRIIRKYIQENI